MNELVTISKLKQAQLAIHEVKELDEIKMLVDQSEALKSYAKAQKLSQEMKDDITEYNLHATRQMGLISVGMEKAKGGRPEAKTLPPLGSVFDTYWELSKQQKSKTETLSEAGIDIRRANEAEKLAAISEEKFTEIITQKREQGELTKTAVMDALTKPHIAQNSGNNEWYTPKEYIEAACEVMGEIDLDPASCETANLVVQAIKYYDANENGLTKEWKGCIWLNPPYAGDLIGQFVDKLVEQYTFGNTKQAIVLVNNATETAWFNSLIKIASAIVFPNSRVKFHMPDGKIGAPLQGQAVVYVGKESERFLNVFSKFGWGAMPTRANQAYSTQATN